MSLITSKKIIRNQGKNKCLNNKISVNLYDKEYIGPNEDQLKLSNDKDGILSDKYNTLKENRKYKQKS